MREVSEKKSGGACALYGASWLLKLSRGGGGGGGHAVIVTAAGGVGDAREAQIRDKASSERGWRRLGKWRSSLPPNNISYLSGDKYRTILR